MLHWDYSMIGKISLHPRVAALASALISLALWGWLRQITTPISVALWWLFYAAWSGALVYGLGYYPPGRLRGQHFLALLTFGSGWLAYLLFSEWPPAWYALGAGGALLIAGSFWLIPNGPGELSFVAKPFRRWCFLMTVVGLGGLWSGLVALLTFHILAFPAWWLVLGTAGITSALSGWWWRAYDVPPGRRFWLSLAALFIIMAEMAGSIVLWPLGYFASGLLLTWWWYVVWLLLRFYNSAEGINWRRQAYFLAINAGLMALYVILAARWH